VTPYFMSALNTCRTDVLHFYIMYTATMTDADTIKLKMTGKLSYDDDITVAQAAQIIAFLHSGMAPSSPAGASHALGVAVPERRQVTSSPRDALELSGAKTNPEKIVAFALYVEQQGGKDTFTVEDIKPLFRQARESTPGNFSRDLDAAIRLNWIAPSTEKGEYYVKDVVANVLESGFDGVSQGRSGTAKAKSVPSRRPRKPSIATPEAFKDMDITPTIEGYINYHKVKAKTDKYLWAVNAAKLWGVEALTNAEIVWLTDKLGAGFSSGDLGGNYRSNYKQGYINKNAEGKTRMTPAGTEHVLSLTAGAGE
jgi:hypothetical protein